MSNIHADRAGEVLGETISLTILATFAVILRFIARSISPAPLWWDDWIIVLSLFLNYGLSSLFWVEARNYGLGRHAVLLSMEDLQSFWKSFLAVEIVYFCNSAATKVSLILLYYRIFGVVRWFRIALAMAGTIVVSYLLACVFASTFGCRPVSYFWDKSILTGKCIDQATFFRYNGVANLCVDFMILCLTMPMVWRLKIGFRQKVTLSCIFLLGTFVCIASIIRVTSFSQFDIQDPSYTTVLTSIWTSVEQSLGIVCACLPVLRPLFHRDFFTPVSKSKATSLTGNTATSNLNLTHKWGSSGERGITGFARLDEADFRGEMPPDQLTESILLQPMGGSVTTEVTKAPKSDLPVIPAAILKGQTIEQHYDRIDGL